MERTLEALKVFASLVSAAAWPLVAAVLLIKFRKQIRALLDAMVDRFKSAESVKIAGFFELVQKKSEEVGPINPKNDRGPTAEQTSLAIAAETLGSRSAIPYIRQEMLDLAVAYEEIRVVMRESSLERTSAMNRIMYRMRALGRAAAPLWREFSSSEKAGERLAAIAIAQMKPDAHYLTWLHQRFRIEKPFVFYHAAIAIYEFAKNAATNDMETIESIIKESLSQVESVRSRGITPDANTLEVLKEALSTIDARSRP